MNPTTANQKPRKSMRRIAHAWRLMLAALVVIATPSFVYAQAAPAPTVPLAPEARGYEPPSGSWAAQLDDLARWAAERKGATACAEHCYTLSRLKLEGSVGSGPLVFELEGAVLAPGAVAIPLFGPPDRVRLEDTTENGKPAIIGFDTKGYFLHTSARRFVLRGKLSIQGDLALQIAGPLNALEADLTGGRVVEGSRLSGLSGATIHFDASTGASPATEPTVFQLSRAIRIGREIGFEYRLVMRSGIDLGVLTLPLRFGEQVLDVQGVTGWRVDGASLVLPTSGRSAQVTITGTLPSVATFTPDERSAYEWWLLESDAQHRLEVEGTARQIERSESPIASTMPTARLYMVQRGQQVSVRVQSLESSEVLAAIVHSYNRMAVLTVKGDAVFDDRLQYENNGIDYLLFSPQGRPIYLDIDGSAQRIMHKQGAEGDVMVPLRTGSHSARIQSLAATGLSTFGGALRVPMGTHTLTSSQVTLTVGLPDHVVPVATAGGDRPEVFAGIGDGIAMLFALAAAMLVTSGRRRRVGAAIAFGGLWFVSPVAFTGAMVLIGLVLTVRLLSRLLRGAQRTAAIAMLTAGGLLVAVIALALVAGTARYGAAPSSAYPEKVRNYEPADATATRESPATGNWAAQSAQGGVLEGVAPVALPLPTFHRSVSITREFVTQDRPFHPVVYYVTAWVLYPLVALWLAIIIALLASHRTQIVALRDRIKRRLDQAPPPPPPPSDEPPAPAPAA